VSISRIDGIPVSGLAKVDGIAMAGLVRVDGLGPLPGTTPVQPDTLPTPYAYWPFAAGLTDVVRLITLTPYSGSSALVQSATGGILDGMVQGVGDGSNQELDAEANRTAIALSIWMKEETLPLDSGGSFPATVLLSSSPSASGEWEIGANAPTNDGQWHHWLLKLTDTSWLVHRDGELYQDIDGSYPVSSKVDSSLSLQLGPGDAAFCEMALFESPAWTDEEMALYAATLYNAGNGVVWRDGQWWEVVA
jgi:hypothetical protein